MKPGPPRTHDGRPRTVALGARLTVRTPASHLQVTERNTALAPRQDTAGAAAPPDGSLRGLALAVQAGSAGSEERGALLAELDELIGWLAARAADAPAQPRTCFGGWRPSAPGPPTISAPPSWTSTPPAVRSPLAGDPGTEP